MIITMRTLVRDYALKMRASAYVYGLTYKGMIYGMKIQNMANTNFRTSKNYALRFRPNMAEKARSLENYIKTP
jgi:hypothetical protein